VARLTGESPMFVARFGSEHRAMAKVTTPQVTVRRAGDRDMVNVTYYVVFDQADVELDQPYSEVCELVGHGRLSAGASVIRAGGAQWLSRSFTRVLARPGTPAQAWRARVTLAPA
jgi:hypothetical protein